MSCGGDGQWMNCVGDGQWMSHGGGGQRMTDVPAAHPIFILNMLTSSFVKCILLIIVIATAIYSHLCGTTEENDQRINRTSDKNTINPLKTGMKELAPKRM